MKRIIKKSTTITEIIKDNKGKEYIVNRRYNVNVSTEPMEKKYPLLLSDNEVYEVDKEVIEKDKYFREEIAKEAEEYKKKHPLHKKEKELPDTSNQKKTDN